MWGRVAYSPRGRRRDFVFMSRIGIDATFLTFFAYNTLHCTYTGNVQTIYKTQYTTWNWSWTLELCRSEIEQEAIGRKSAFGEVSISIEFVSWFKSSTLSSPLGAYTSSSYSYCSFLGDSLSPPTSLRSATNAQLSTTPNPRHNPRRIRDLCHRPSEDFIIYRIPPTSFFTLCSIPNSDRYLPQDPPAAF